MMNRGTLQALKELNLTQKIALTQSRIRDYYRHFNGNIYVSFSGGKDSTVLLDIVRSVYPSVPAVFYNTGLEYPEIVDHVRKTKNVIEVRPKITFKQTIEQYGYPVVSKEVAQKIHEIRTTKSSKLRNKRLHGDNKGNGKIPEKWKFLIDAPFKISHRCCYHLKKSPSKHFEKESGLHPIVGMMTEDSTLRVTNYLKYGCNQFTSNRPMSTPMAFWTEADVWDYIHTQKLPVSSIYSKGYTRTGCMFCLFGVGLEKYRTGINKFDLMKETHPGLYDYCMNTLDCRSVLNYVYQGEYEE